jgi:hypothetical protein
VNLSLHEAVCFQWKHVNTGWHRSRRPRQHRPQSRNSPESPDYTAQLLSLNQAPWPNSINIINSGLFGVGRALQRAHALQSNALQSNAPTEWTPKPVLDLTMPVTVLKLTMRVAVLAAHGELSCC